MRVVCQKKHEILNDRKELHHLIVCHIADWAFNSQYSAVQYSTASQSLRARQSHGLQAITTYEHTAKGSTANPFCNGKACLVYYRWQLNNICSDIIICYTALQSALKSCSCCRTWGSMSIKWLFTQKQGSIWYAHNLTHVPKLLRVLHKFIWLEYNSLTLIYPGKVDWAHTCSFFSNVLLHSYSSQLGASGSFILS